MGVMKDECQHMMTRIKLNYYRAEEEMLIMERIRWRRAMEERRRLWKKTEKELEKLRVQEFILFIFFYPLTAAYRCDQPKQYVLKHCLYFPDSPLAQQKMRYFTTFFVAPLVIQLFVPFTLLVKSTDCY